MQHRIVVYIDVGVYTEQLNVRAGLTYQGAWTFGQNGGWTRLCTGDSPIPSAVTIKAPSNKNVTASARNLNGEAALEALTLVGRDLPAAPGESMYGLMVVGDTALTRVSLVDVFVSAPRAGDGKSGGIGATGATGPATCAAGDPVTPAQEAPGAGGQAKNAVFDANGYHPADGTAGKVGRAGGNGKSNGGESKGCHGCGPDTAYLHICTYWNYTAQGGASTPGCGGAGGDGGPIGGGGGSSFGVFVWGATVGAERGGFVAREGGGGGAGGEGGQGGAATGGTDGTSAACATNPKPTCTAGGGADYPNNCSDGDILGTPAAGGHASAGAKGGTGGTGGGGAGGSSYAYYAGGSGVVALNGTTLTHGGGGRAGSNGVPAATAGAGAEHN